MPKLKHQQQLGNEDGSVTGSDPGSSSNRNRNGKNGKTKGHYADIQSNSERSGTKSPEHGVSQIAEATNGFLLRLGETQTELTSVMDMYRKHATEIAEVDATRHKLIALQEAEKAKDQVIEELETTVHNIRRLNYEEHKELAAQKEANDLEKMELQAERAQILKAKEKEENRAKAKEAERKLAHDEELKKAKAALTTSFQKKAAEMEKKMREEEGVRRKEAIALEHQVQELSRELQVARDEIFKQKAAVAAKEESLLDLKKLRQISRDEAAKATRDLERLKGEFGLVNHTPEFYRHRFEDIAKLTSIISVRCGQKLESQSWSSIHAQLKTLDPCFASIPISDSEESGLLRAAHVQRIISIQLCKIILQPFSSDETFQPERQDAVTLLEKVFSALGQGYSRRAATVFQALAVRGLSHNLSTQSEAGSLRQSRAETFVKAVLPATSLLTPDSELQALESDLAALAKLTISTWAFAQSEEELVIEVRLDLRLELRKEWRSPVYDPDHDTTNAAAASSARPGTFTLFPNIAARSYAETDETSDVQVPGSFEQANVTVSGQAITIHPGIGMAGSSALVVRGKQEQERMEEDEKVENLKQQADEVKRALEDIEKSKSQRTGSVSSPSSPSSS